MGKILGIKIQNYGSLKYIKMGKLFSDQTGSELGNMVAIIGTSGNGKSTLADAFGFISDCISSDVETACDINNRGGYDQLISQHSDEPIHFELYYKENSNSRPITYELTISKDHNDRPYVKEERLRQQRIGNKRGWPLSFLHLSDGKGYAFEGGEGGQDDDGATEGDKVDVELSDPRKLGIVTLGAMKQYSRIEKFLTFLKSWYLCYFTPDAARQIQTASPAQYLNRTGSNLNNVAQYMYRENPFSDHMVMVSCSTSDSLHSIALPQPLPLFVSIDSYLRCHHPYTDPNYTLQQLADSQEVKPFIVSKAIKSGGFTGFREYINCLRLEYFKRLAAEENNLSIKELMFRSGYTSRSTFYRNFAARYGISPTKYLENQ